jgi:hypothetical protein
VIGVYIAWRGKDLSVPGLDLLTFWNRKLAGGEVAAQNSCLATINELALAAREPGKKVHHCVLMGHSFGGLVLSNTISHSILDASSTAARNASPWDMAVAFNPADNSIGSRRLMSELDYLYKYDATRGAYVGRTPGAEEGAVLKEDRPLLIVLQSENDQATGKFFLPDRVSPTRSIFITTGTGLRCLVAVDKKSRKMSSKPTRLATTNIS